MPSYNIIVCPICRRKIRTSKGKIYSHVTECIAGAPLCLASNKETFPVRYPTAKEPTKEASEPICSKSGKISYGTRPAAQEVADITMMANFSRKRINKGICRVYVCPHCDTYHITSQLKRDQTAIGA